MMDALHATRHERCLIRRDIGYEKGYHWQDNTIALAATIYNGNTRATKHFAHTARIIYDKHWHGRNRAKNRSLTAEERDVVETCYLCGATDSQGRAFRSGIHGNIVAIREQTNDSLKERIEHYRQEAEGTERPMTKRRHALLTSIYSTNYTAVQKQHGYRQGTGTE